MRHQKTIVRIWKQGGTGEIRAVQGGIQQLLFVAIFTSCRLDLVQ